MIGISYSWAHILLTAGQGEPLHAHIYPSLLILHSLGCVGCKCWGQGYILDKIPTQRDKQASRLLPLNIELPFDSGRKWSIFQTRRFFCNLFLTHNVAYSCTKRKNKVQRCKEECANFYLAQPHWSSRQYGEVIFKPLHSSLILTPSSWQAH